MASRCDFFGRTEAELVATIAWQERVIVIAASYSGNEGIALKLAIKRATLAVDRRCLEELRTGKPVRLDPPIPPPLSGAALEKWRQTICSMGYTHPRKGKK